MPAATAALELMEGVTDMPIAMRNLESAIFYMMDIALGAVKLPSVRIPSVADQAKALLEEHGGCCVTAIEEAARFEDDASWRTKLPDFLLQQVPVVGCSTLVLRELWRNIRRCALIAHLYGHDTSSPETRALILTCLVPTGGGQPSGGAPASPSRGGAGGGGPEVVLNSSLVVRSVSRALARETVFRATGFRFARQVVGLLEGVGGLVTCAWGAPGATVGAAAAGGAGGAAAAAAAAGAAGAAAGAAAAEVAGQERLLPAAPAADDPAAQTSPAKVATVVFRPPSGEEKPVVVVGLLLIWLLPIFVSAGRFVAARLVPILASRVQMEVPVAAVVAAVLATQALGVAVVIWVRRNGATFVSIPATLIFVIYAILPGTSIFLASRSMLQAASEPPFFALLAVCNLASGYLRWADDLRDDAKLDGKEAPWVVQARDRVQFWRTCLWVFLLLVFILEELLGRVLRLHSIRFLGPAAAATHLTLVEYRTLAFAMGLVAAWSQARVLELLQRRTVLMRLLGARQAILAGSALLLMGIYAFAQYGRTVGFLRDVSPTPRWCCTVLWIRRYGAVAGFAVPIVFHLLSPRYLGALPESLLLPVALATGALVGVLCTWGWTCIWQERREHLESDYRVLHLLPHMSAQGRKFAERAMRLARKRAAEAAKNTTVEWAVSTMVRTAADYVATSLVAGPTALKL